MRSDPENKIGDERWGDKKGEKLNCPSQDDSAPVSPASHAVLPMSKRIFLNYILSYISMNTPVINFADAKFVQLEYLLEVELRAQAFFSAHFFGDDERYAIFESIKFGNIANNTLKWIRINPNRVLIQNQAELP